jgi:ketosteroid isomerase-like protein
LTSKRWPLQDVFTSNDWEVVMPDAEVVATQPANDGEVSVLAELYAAISAGDFGRVAALLSEDSVLHVPGRSANTGDYAGAEGAIAFLTGAFAVTGGTLRLQVHRILDDGEWAVALATYTASRPDRSVPLENNLAHVVRLRDGRIAEQWLHSRDQYEVDEFWGLP